MANFLLKRTIVFLELFRLFTVLWQPSMSLDFTSIPVRVNIEIAFSSKQLSSTGSGIPDTSILFLLPYCSSFFWLISGEVTLLSEFPTFSLKHSFSACRFLMMTSFTFNSSFVGSSNRDSNFVSKFVIFSDVATLVVVPEVSLLPSKF